MGFSNLGDQLKLVTPVVGIVSISLISWDRFFKWEEYDKTSLETYFFAISIVALIVSYGVLVLTALGTIKRVSQWKNIDAGVHAVTGLLLLIGGIVYIVAMVGTDKRYNEEIPWYLKPKEYKDKTVRRSCALIFEIMNSCLYFRVAFLRYKS